MRLRHALFVGLAFTLASTDVHAQYSSRIYTRAQEPPVEALDRLNLRIAWRVSLPAESLRDGIGMVQWIDDQVFIQTKSSQLIVLEASTGRLMWQTRPYHFYGNVYGVATNSKYVYFANGSHIYSYDRKTGIQEFDFDMGTTVSTAPVADHEAVYVALGNDNIIKYGLPFPVRTLKPRVQKKDDTSPNQQREDAPLNPDGRYYRSRRTAESTVEQIRAGRPPIQLNTQGAEIGNEQNRTPSISLLPTLRPPYRLDNGGKTESVAILETVQPPYRLPDGSRSPSITAIPTSVVRLGQLMEMSPRALEPRLTWKYQANVRVHFPPLITTDRLLAPTTRELLFAIGVQEPKPVYEFDSGAMISAPLAQYGETAYIPTANSQLYALSIVTGRLEWRFTGGGPLNHRPVVTDQQVFVSGYNAGVSAMDRMNGTHQWVHGKSERVRAVNPKFVYTTDRLGNLYVLDRVRGLELTKLPLPDFTVPITNIATDRLLLASNNGLLLCLHDKDFRDPLRLQNPAKDAEPKKEEPKEEMPAAPAAPEPPAPPAKKDANE